MKAFTDFEQSKKLAEILPHESADMSYRPYKEEGGITDYQADLCPHRFASWFGVPCWSLAALLNTIPITCDDGRHCLALINSNPAGTIEWLCCYEDCNGNMMHESYASNQVEACYEMILKLHDKKLL